MADEYDALRLENQICFPLYACAKEIINAYKPYLDELDLTYTQYLTMMVLWEHNELRVKEIGKYLYLDSGTMTPVLKKLEKKGYISRKRDKADERGLIITITDAGEALRDKAVTIPEQVSSCISMESQDAKKLYDLLYKLMGNLLE